MSGHDVEQHVLSSGCPLSGRPWSLMVSVRRTVAVVASLRERGLHLAVYTDDWLLLACTDREAVTYTAIALAQLGDLCLLVKRETSGLIVKQKITVLGLSLDSLVFPAHLPTESGHITAHSMIGKTCHTGRLPHASFTCWPA